MRIIDDEAVTGYLDQFNPKPAFSAKQLQIHMHYQGGCCITQDKMGSSLLPCADHRDYFMNLRDNKVLHKNLH